MNDLRLRTIWNRESIWSRTVWDRAQVGVSPSGSVHRWRSNGQCFCFRSERGDLCLLTGVAETVMDDHGSAMATEERRRKC